MNALAHFAASGMAAALLALSASQLKADMKMTSPNGVQLIDKIWMVTYVDSGGREIVIQAKLTTGESVPLIAADTERLESMMPAARALAKASNKQLYLVKFSNRTVVEEIRP